MNKEDLKVMQVEIIGISKPLKNGYIGRRIDSESLKKLNDFLATLDPNNIIEIVPYEPREWDPMVMVKYLVHLKVCELCGGYIVNGSCSQCKDGEDKKNE